MKRRLHLNILSQSWYKKTAVFCREKKSSVTDLSVYLYNIKYVILQNIYWTASAELEWIHTACSTGSFSQQLISLAQGL